MDGKRVRELDGKLKLEKQCNERLRKEAVWLQAENKRLREALQSVVNTGQSPLPSRRKAKEMTIIAIEALEAIEGSGE